MKTNASLLPRKTILIALVLLAALGVGIPQQMKLNQELRALAEARGERIDLDARVAAATAALAGVREELRAEKGSRKQVMGAVAEAEQAMVKVSPESRWAVAPANLPDWNAESPYVWLRKEMLPKLPVEVFTKNGELQPEVAMVLAASGSQQGALNAKLTRLLGDFHELQVAKAQRIDEHPPGIAGEEGIKVTVRVEPLREEGGRLKQEFEAALSDELGAQRADMLTQTAESWLDSQFSQFGMEPMIISMIRHPDGSLNVSIKSGGSSMFTSGRRSIEQNIPAHLLPMFAEVLEQKDSASASQPVK
ncbi:MAG: hypothetical protein JWR19_1739 [Pedosphaera sp.]|nr:hypothetical protein [Pedosphaera sp.]